ncbi:MAG: L-threonylcarbamoyladenylate synthase [Acutalibacter sp.]|jgi:L-threonylcarbamoyladenylate synthase
METLLLSDRCPGDIEKAGEILRRGGLVAIPTETVYGLAANALDGEAVKKIYQAKGRPSDNPLIVHISDVSQLPPLVKEVPEAARKLAAAFWPGPLTIILEKSQKIPDQTSGGLETVAVRCPFHPTARAVIDAAGVPLAAPSANLSGKPSPTTFHHVQEDLTGRVDALLDGGDCTVGVESTVLTLVSGTPRILRPGGVTLAQLEHVLGHVEVDPAVLHQMEQGQKAASPGMKYKHYSPAADVVILDASPEDYLQYVNERGDGWALCFDEDVPFLQVPTMPYGSRYDDASQAHRLFEALHQLDEAGAKKAYARIPRKRGVGLAVYNRLIRAAAFQVVNPRGLQIVGLTGPTGAGKSTVGEFLQAHGCWIIDCDKATRSPQVYDGACLAELSAAFGPEVLRDGALDRGELARRAFASQEARTRLGEITFPRILRRVRELIQTGVDQGCRILVLDAPTLFESGLDSACSRILVVDAPKEERLARVLQRDGITKEAALRRLEAQPSPDFYTSRGDWVVENPAGTQLEKLLAPILDELENACL